MLKTLRDRGLKAVIFEAGNDTGGTWRWNVSKPRRPVYAFAPQVICFFCADRHSKIIYASKSLPNIGK